MTIVAVPEMEAHSPDELRKEMFVCGSESMSLVLPDSVLVWKIRSIPPVSYWSVRCVEEFCTDRSCTCAANAMQRETKAPEEPSRVVIMPNLQAVMNSLRPSTFSLMETLSMFLA